MAGGLCPWGPLPRQRREDRKKGPVKTKLAQHGPSIRGVAYPAPADPAFAGTAVKPRLTLRSPCLGSTILSSADRSKRIRDSECGGSVKRVLEVGVSRTDFLSNAAIGGELLADRLARKPWRPPSRKRRMNCLKSGGGSIMKSCLVRGICG